MFSFLCFCPKYPYCLGNDSDSGQLSEQGICAVPATPGLYRAIGTEAAKPAKYTTMKCTLLIMQQILHT